MTLSLNTRLLLTGSLVLAAFLGATGLVLDKAFHDSAETALRDRLQGHIYALLAASDLDSRGALQLPPELPDPRLSQPGSGLYAEVMNAAGTPVWQARSMLGIALPAVPPGAIGQREFTRIAMADGTPLASLVFTISWESGAGADQRYSYRVAENLASFNNQIRQFRRSLWGWLGGAALLLLVVQGLVLRWGLAPVRRVAEELRAIETGLAQRLSGDYPRELRPLTDNLNGLLDSAAARLQRYRDSLGNLSHSLKTPLAVLRGALDSEADPGRLRETAREQLAAMTRLIEYQLQRAAAAGRSTSAAPVPIRPLTESIIAALSKVYAGKGVRFTLTIEDDAVFRGDRGDLTEMLGNLLDNAGKWCRAQVRLTAARVRPPGSLRPELEITVEDDGPGISGEMRERVLQRGVRADETTPGHGLGLAMVQDTVLLYDGQLLLEPSTLGGLMARLRFAGV